MAQAVHSWSKATIWRPCRKSDKHYSFNRILYGLHSVRITNDHADKQTVEELEEKIVIRFYAVSGALDLLD